MYVRKTQTLVDDIDYEVDKMRNNALHQLKQDTKIEIGTPLHAELKSVVETALWQDAPDLKDKMPNAWCKMESQVTIKFEQVDKKAIRVDLDTTDTDKLKFPPNHNRWDIQTIHEKHWTPLVKQWLSRRNTKEVEHDEVQETYRVIAKQLVSFMGKHASLNTAIKEMPELKLYVPSHYIEKLEKQENRIKAKPKAPTTDDDVAVDVEALTRAAIAHRITTANQE